MKRGEKALFALADFYGGGGQALRRAGHGEHEPDYD